MGLNIGQAALQVTLLAKSPFAGQTKQETSLHFTQAVFSRLADRDNIFQIPAPLNGVRITEELRGFDNFLTDGKTLLEDAFFDQTVEVKGEDGETSTVSSRIDFDSTAAARVKELRGEEEKASERADNSQGSQASTPSEVAAARNTAEQNIEEDQAEEASEGEKEFFTWRVSENIFNKGKNNPKPPKFTDPPRFDNSPEWTYVALPRPGNDVNNLMLTPFMKKNPPDSASPVHWGCTMTQSLATNQPFEILYFFCLRDPSVAKDAPPQQPRYKFKDTDGTEIDLKLSNSVYLAIEFGKSSSNNFLIMLINETTPFLFELKGGSKTREATLIAKFDKFNSAKLFNPNNKFFTISVEPVLGSFIIRSNIFSDTPWLINAPLDNPVSVGAGPIAIYGGNVQSGFALRPIQYKDTGKFKTPEITFNIEKDGEDPVCTTATKGAGEVEQQRSYGEGGKEGSDGKVHMVDSEQVNGQGVQSVLKASESEATDGSSSKRDILIELSEVKDDDPSGDGADAADITTKMFENKVTLKPGDMEQGNGYVVKRGRSPYLVALRCGVEASSGASEGSGIDISCDVMSVDLNWNATSYQEIRHTGSISVLNIRNVSGTDYRKYSNRSIYLKIAAGWVGGVGADNGIKTIFTGKTVKVEVSSRAEREVVTFQIEDYMTALDGVKFILSPYYDGMSAALAVRDIVLQSGLSDDRILMNGTKIKDANLKKDLGLPIVNPLATPKFRFKDGSSLKDGILRIAKLDFKTIFFDAIGNFHYQDMPGGLFNNKNFTIKETFWSTNNGASASGGANKPQNQAWSMTSFSRLINDTYNVIQVFSADKRTLARITAGSAYSAGISDPEAEGYMGYRKHLIIAEPALGDINAVFRYLDNYRRRVIIPPLSGKFEVYGKNNLQPLDVIEVDGQLLRIMNIQTRLNKAENTYYQNIEGEWMFAAAAGKDQQPNLTPTTSGPSTGGNNAGKASTQ